MTYTGDRYEVDPKKWRFTLLKALRYGVPFRRNLSHQERVKRLSPPLTQEKKQCGPNALKKIVQFQTGKDVVDVQKLWEAQGKGPSALQCMQAAKKLGYIKDFDKIQMTIKGWQFYLKQRWCIFAFIPRYKDSWECGRETGFLDNSGELVKNDIGHRTVIFDYNEDGFWIWDSKGRGGIYGDGTVQLRYEDFGKLRDNNYLLFI